MGELEYLTSEAHDGRVRQTAAILADLESYGAGARWAIELVLALANSNTRGPDRLDRAIRAGQEALATLEAGELMGGGIEPDPDAEDRAACEAAEALLLGLVSDTDK